MITLYGSPGFWGDRAVRSFPPTKPNEGQSLVPSYIPSCQYTLTPRLEPRGVPSSARVSRTKAPHHRTGEHVTFIFEDELTMRHQIRRCCVERLRERIRTSSTPQSARRRRQLEGDDADQYPDETRAAAYARRLIGIEDRVWVQVGTRACIAMGKIWTARAPRLRPFISCASMSGQPRRAPSSRVPGRRSVGVVPAYNVTCRGP
jgi:hypothetical protein